jgi:uncharacterized protein with PIN domain
MIVDASAVLAILLHEEDAASFARAIEHCLCVTDVSLTTTGRQNSLLQMSCSGLTRASSGPAGQARG